MVQCILTDIEGTTSSISFVKDVLFPYAARELPGYIAAHRNEPEVQKIIADTCATAGLEKIDADAAVNRLLNWIAEDKKVTPLKTLQGLIWEAGYRQGAYQAHMYRDACEVLQRWHADGLPIYVYSSGSIYAQQLFFGHTCFGDLRYLFSGYFDTTSGNKREAQSYRTIVAQLPAPAAQVLFLSDVAEELDAAAEAGLRTTLVDRDGQAGGTRHPRVVDFHQIRFT